MRNILLFIGVFFLLVGCTKSKKEDGFVNIFMNSLDYKYNYRNGEDYVKLWVNDTLLFGGTFYVDNTDSIQYIKNYLRMKVASILKANRDSAIIKIQLVSLDSVLFANQHTIDTTFRYRIDNIPYIVIDYFRDGNHFRVDDPVKNPSAFYLD